MKNIFKRWPILIGFILVVFAVIGTYIYFTRPAQSVTQTATVTKGALTKKIGLSGFVSSTKVQQAGFTSSGVVKNVSVKTGDIVKKGTALAELDTTTLAVQVAKSEASLRIAQNNLKNTQTKGHYTAYDIMNLKEQIKLGESTLAADRDALNKATIRAEFDGVVAAVNIRIGDQVTASGSTSTHSSSSSTTYPVILYDPNSLSVSLSVSEHDIGKITNGLPVEITVDSQKSRTFTGKVDNFQLWGQSSSGVVNYSAVALFDKGDASIKPSMNATVSVILESKADILLVPNTFIKTTGGTKTVTRITNGIAQEVTITIGVTDGQFTEVVEGLTEGDTISRTILATARQSTTTIGIPGLNGGTGTRTGTFQRN